MRILADHVTYSFLAFMKSIFHFCLGCYCGGYSQNGRSNLSSWFWFLNWIVCLVSNIFAVGYVWNLAGIYIKCPTHCICSQFFLMIHVCSRSGRFTAIEAGIIDSHINWIWKCLLFILVMHVLAGFSWLWQTLVRRDFQTVAMLRDGIIEGT